MKPVVGMIVHLNVGGNVLAAIITNICHIDRVDLCVFDRNAMVFAMDVPHGNQDGHWSWTTEELISD